MVEDEHPISTHSYCPPSSRVWDMMCPYRIRCWAVLSHPGAWQSVRRSHERFRCGQGSCSGISRRAAKHSFWPERAESVILRIPLPCEMRSPNFPFTVSVLYNSSRHAISLQPGSALHSALSPFQHSSSFPILTPLSVEHRDVEWLETQCDSLRGWLIWCVLLAAANVPWWVFAGILLCLLLWTLPADITAGTCSAWRDGTAAGLWSGEITLASLPVVLVFSWVASGEKKNSISW